MTWFAFSLITVLGWGLADLFYKKSSDENDRYSHLKIAVWVGLVMGVCSFALLPFSETALTFGSFFKNVLKYSPASIGYIVSMVIGYAGMRYLEASIISPVQNSSGALTAVCILIFYLATGRISGIGDMLSPLEIVGTLIIVVGVILLAVTEQKMSGVQNESRKNRFGALALMFPILYCVFDTIGTTADGIILDEENGLGLGEIDVLILYGFTFLVFAIGAWIFMLCKSGKAYNPFKPAEIKTKGVAALCEEFGQFFYVFAMAANPVLAAPMIAAYCIFSVIFCRIFIKEKLTPALYLCVGIVILGIVLLGISDGMAEM